MRLLCVLILTGLGGMSCKQAATSSSSVKLSGGTDDNSYGQPQYPAVYGIGDSSEYPTQPFCTATAVSSSVLITAKHCLIDDNGKDVNANAIWAIDGLRTVPVPVPYNASSQNPTKATALATNPAADGQFAADIYLQYDTGFLRFPAGTFGVYLPLASAQPAKGDPVVIVGYGFDTADPKAKVGRQYGANKVADVLTGVTADELHGPSMIKITSDGGVISVPGDSGGPILINGAIAGTLFGKGNAPSERVYTNIFAQKNIDLMNKLAGQGWDIPNIPTTAWVDPTSASTDLSSATITSINAGVSGAGVSGSGVSGN